MRGVLFVLCFYALFAFHVASLRLCIGVYRSRLYDGLVVGVFDRFVGFLFAFKRILYAGPCDGLGTGVCMWLLYR